MPAIAKTTLKFLQQLANNNNREWFNTHKNNYVEAHSNMCEFVDSVIIEMKKHDALENESGKKSLYRIYSDVRFSKDKAPYTAKFAFSLKRATKYKRGGYYVHIKPGNSFLACGFFSPNPEDLKRIRQDIELNDADWNKILKSKLIKENFGNITGKQLSSAPRGFSKDHPALELLKQKQFILRHNFTDQEVLAEGFEKEVNRIFKSVRPYFNYMSEVLTTDLNGESIV